MPSETTEAQYPRRCQQMARKLATDSSALPPESIWIDTCWASTLWITVSYELQGDQKIPSYEAMVCWEDGTHIYRFPGDLDSAAAAAAKSFQSCPTLCDPIDGSPPGSPVPGILQARTLEWVAISFSNAWKWKVKEVAQSCPTRSDPMDCSLPGSSAHGIFQARVLQWGAIAFYTP